MADLYSRNVNTKFTGLTTTVALFGVVGVVALVGFETLRQVRRLPSTRLAPIWKRDPLEQQGGRGGIDPDSDKRGGNVVGTREKLTCEDWEMGHLYLARQFHAITPTPLMARWPLAWAWQALKTDDWFFATHTGMDTVVYVRFLRACMWWMLLQTLTTAPILLAIHFRFAVKSHSGDDIMFYNGTEVLNPTGPISLNDMSQASLSYLVTTTICMCANGTYSRQPCDDTPATDTSKTSSVTNFRNCDHVPNASGRKLLWVHLLLLWYITFTWFYALWWIGKGSLRIRKRWIETVRVKRQKAVDSRKSLRIKDMPLHEQSADDAEDAERHHAAVRTRQILEEKHGLGNLVRGDEHDGWRQRTLLVTNLPPTMRDEASIRRYFEEFLRPDDASSIGSVDEDATPASAATRESETADEDVEAQDLKSKPFIVEQNQQESEVDGAEPGRNNGPSGQPHGPEPDVNPDRHLRSPVQTVVLVRKMNELSAMLSRRQEVLSKLEAAHIRLAQAVMTKVGQNTKAMRKDDAKHGGIGGLGGLGKGKAHSSRILQKWKKPRYSNGEIMSAEDVEKTAAAQASEDQRRLNELSRRLARFSPNNRGMHTREAQARGDDESGGNEMTDTVWEALAQVPRDLLDPYQPVTRLSSLFRGQKVPSIDYLLTKLNLLTALVTEMRARPPSSYEATSTAFVTFRDPRQARMVWRELKTQIVVKVRLAPEVKDLDWERLMRTTFTGDIVRGLGVNVFFWAFTILWVIPVALLTTSLFSVEKLEGVFPALQTFFRNNPRFEGFISVTLPTIIVALLTLAVPELIFQISKRAQGFVTFSALYDECLCRYWKFIICNVVIFFCIGATTVQSILFQLGTNNNVLNAIAFSFPTAAPFYISYLILGLGVHTGFELLGFMVPLIQHLSARNALTPRVRALKTLPRNFNRYYWLPLHILILSIVFLFALLNPLVIPFALVYSWLALAVFKKNFAYQYFRRFNEKEGVVYFLRLLRFSLDGLLVAQIVLLIFFSVTRQEAAYIALTAVLLPINVAVKLLGTRLWKSQCRAVEDEEANALCGIGSSEPLTPSVQRDYLARGSMYGQANDYTSYGTPLDARASGRYPAVVVAPTGTSRLANLWNKIHEGFNANGHDRPSYMIGGGSQHMHGNHLSAKTVTHAVASAPIAVARRTAKRSRHLAKATSEAASVPATGFKLSRSLAVSSTFPSRDEQSTSPHNRSSEGPLAASSARDLKSTLAGGEEAHLKFRLAAKRSMHGHRRRRSDEAPFLSGYEAIANHAPVVGSDDGSQCSLDDGEFEEMLSLQRRETVASKQQKRRQSHMRRSVSLGRSASTNLMFERRATLDDAADKSNTIDDPLHAHQRTMTHGTEGLPMSRSHNEKVAFVMPPHGYRTGSAIDLSHDSDLEDDASIDGGPLVRPHAKVRWDDTPNNHARYNNPYYAVELDPFLWLPRDPMAPVDLCDTIEWHGAALVSSQGGQGRVGEWDDDEDDDDNEERDAEDGRLDEEEKLAGYGSGNVSAAVARGTSSAFPLQGDEKIAISGMLAQRIQEAEDLDHASDPAKSVPRNLLDDYKRALDEDAMAESMEEDRGGDPSLLSPHTIRLPRRSSSAHRRSSSFSAQDQARQSPTSPQMSLPDPSASPITGRRQSVRSQRRDPSIASSIRSAEGGDAARPTRVSMRRALKAEVMEEEYLLTVKDRVTRHSRRSDNMSILTSTKEASEEDGVGSKNGSKTNVGETSMKAQPIVPERHRSLHGSPPYARQTFLSPRKWTTIKGDRRNSGYSASGGGGGGGANVTRSMSGSTFASTQPGGQALQLGNQTGNESEVEQQAGMAMEQLRRSPDRMTTGEQLTANAATLDRQQGSDARQR